MKCGMQKFDRLILNKRGEKHISLLSIHTGREITGGLGYQVHELWTVEATKVFLIFCQGYGMVRTGKNKSNSEMPYQVCKFFVSKILPDC